MLCDTFCARSQVQCECAHTHTLSLSTVYLFLFTHRHTHTPTLGTLDQLGLVFFSSVTRRFGSPASRGLCARRCCWAPEWGGGSFVRCKRVQMELNARACGSAIYADRSAPLRCGPRHLGDDVAAWYASGALRTVTPRANAATSATSADESAANGFAAKRASKHSTAVCRRRRLRTRFHSHSR